MDNSTESFALTQHQQLELEILKKEYFFLQTTVEDYNKQIWIIKSLGISGTGAVIWLTLQQGEQIFALIGCSIPAFFWLLESQWKHFQRGFYPRIQQIEYLLQQEFKLSAPAIMSTWSEVFKRPARLSIRGYVWDGLLNPSVYLSYVLQIAFLIAISFVEDL